MVAGLSLVAVGVFLSIPGVPGPGLPIVLIGLAIMEWPGKARFFAWLGRYPWFARMNRWTVRRFGFGFPHANLAR